MAYTIDICVGLFVLTCCLLCSDGKNLDAKVKTNATGEGLPSAGTLDAAFVEKVVQLKKQALKIMQLRGKKVDVNVKLDADANWDDLQLDETLYASIKKSFDEEEKRLTSKNETDRMAAPNFRLIPYAKWSMPIQYTTNLVVDEVKLPLIEDALAEIQSKTCIKFEHVDSSPEGPHIEYKEVNNLGRACANSPLGVQPKKMGANGQAIPPKNTINIMYSCVSAGAYLHETLHSLGFHHTQTRPDVDQYMDIDWDNIYEANKHNFKPWAYALTDQGPYDFGSIMQYHRFAFAIDTKRPTLEPKVDPETNRKLMGQEKGLSDEDVRLLNKLYCEDPEPDKNAECIDKTLTCFEHAKIGYCEEDSVYYSYMKDSCRLSCKFCSEN